eukprot:CAMPEP_0171063710 /NCGR_PEP_ID=MMETSP0766_2-20121228/5837_1 /TAXON_ID=439317 /ORGANISM="Gambierdiscus australes, Strain CAWD 149" /LENGTH=97 /DNA_ID=CAMNT_0011519655 /DNA_START=713 /DNA_END=1006 /DNA_ORIENTATION=-
MESGKLIIGNEASSAFDDVTPNHLLGVEVANDSSWSASPKLPAEVLRECSDQRWLTFSGSAKVGESAGGGESMWPSRKMGAKQAGGGHVGTIAPDGN